MKKQFFLFAPFIIFILVACISPIAPPVAEASYTATLSAPSAVDMGMLGHGMAVTAAWAVDGKMLAVGSTRGIYLYDTTTWQVLQFIKTPDDKYSGIKQIWFHPDGNLYYVYSSDFTSGMTLGLYRYDLSANESSRMYADLTFPNQTTIIFSADGTRFVNIGSLILDTDKSHDFLPYIEIRDSGTGEIVRTITPDAIWRSEFTSKQVAFSPDGVLFAAGGEDNTVRVWDVKNGTLLFEQTHDANIQALAFSPDGKIIVSTGDDAIVRFWDARTGENLFLLREFDRRVTYLAYSMNGSELLIGLSDGFFQRWAIDENFLPVAHKKADFDLERRKYASVASSEYISPDGSRLAVIDEANLQIFDLAATNEPVTLAEFNSHLTTIEFSPDGSLLALVDQNVHLWDVESHKAVGNLQIRSSGVHDIAFTPDGKQLAITSNTLQIWDIATLQKVKEIDTVARLVDYSPDGSLLATGDWYDVTVWNAESGKKIRSFKSGLSTPYALSFTADGSALIFAAQNGIGMWEVSSGKLLRAIDAKEGTMDEALIYSSYHVVVKNFLNCMDGGELNFWDLRTGLSLYTLNIPSCGGLKGMTFHPSERLFAYVTGYDKSTQIILSDPASGQSLFSIPLPDQYIESMRFSPDGKFLAAEESDNTVHLWDVSSVSHLAELSQAVTATPLPTKTPIPSPTPAIAEEIPQPLVTPRAPNPSAISVENINDLKEIGTLGDLRYLRPSVIAWSSDGVNFALGSLGMVSVYKVGVSTPWRSFAGGNLVESLTFSPDGHFLAEQNNGNETIVWDLLEGKRAHTFNEGCWSSELSFSINSQILAVTGCMGNETLFFDMISGRLISKEKIRLHGKSNFDGSLLVASDSDYVYLKDAQSGNILRTFESGTRPWHSSFSPDGQNIFIWNYGVPFEKIVNGEKQTIYESVAEFWQTLPGQEPVLRRTILTGPANMEVPPSGQTYAFTSDGKHLITAVWDGFVRIWDTDTGELLSELQGGYYIFLSADDKKLIMLFSSGRVQVWDIKSIGKPKLIQTITNFEEQYFSCPIYFVNDGKGVVSLSAWTSIAQWKIAGETIDPKPAFQKIGDRARAFAASLDGAYWATDNPDGGIDLRDPKTGQVIRTLIRPPESLAGNDVDDMIETLMFSNSGDRLLAANSWHVWLWDVKTGKMAHLIKPDISIGDLAFSPDGRLLAFSESYGSKADIWDTQTGKRLRHFDFANEKIAFSPDGLTLAAGVQRDGKIQIFDIRSGQVIRTLQTGNRLWDITFTPDGNMLIVSAEDKIEFWDIAQSIRLSVIPWFAQCLSISPDGAILATYSTGSRIHLWGVAGQ